MVSLGNLVVGAFALALVAVTAAWAVRHYAIPTVLRRSARVLRIDARSLAVGLVLLAAAGAGVVAVADPGAPIVTALLGFLALAGVLGLTVAVANLDWYRAARSLPVRSPADVEPGPVQVEGTVAAPAEPVESAVTRTESVAYRAATLEEHAVLGRGQNGSTWSPTSTAYDATAFSLRGGGSSDDATDAAESAAENDTDVAGSDPDAAGRSTDATGNETDVARISTDAAGNEADATDASAASVAVDADAASFPLLSPGVRALVFTPAGGPLAGLERTVFAEPGTTVPIGDDLGRGARPRPRRYTERRIDPDDEVYALGTAERGPDGTRLVDDPDGPPLLVARLGADEARRHARQMVLGYGALGLVALAAAAGVALQLR